MSRLSGKCDVLDTAEICGLHYMLNSKIYHNGELLDIKKERDLIPWYPYLIATSCGDKDGAVIHLSERDFISREEEECLTYRLESIKKAYRRCKRKHEEFNIEEIYQNQCWLFPRPELRVLIERVAEQGNKATIDEIYDRRHEHYRQEWRKELLKYGYDAEWIEEWIYKGRKH